MYHLAESITPESLYAVARLAYAELAMAGICTVGEFHYLHHQADGTPYDDRVALADAVIRAATDVGLRITLLRVAYQRAGVGRELESGQRRFCDAKIDDALSDVELLQKRWGTHSLVQIGVAAHSVRALPRDSIKELSAYARDKQLPMHMHVAEQPREIEESLAEYGKRPVELLADDGILDERFVAVHATHLEDQEVKLLGQGASHVCLCRTTERDLGDGLARSSELLSAGVTLSTGVDSYAISDPFEEARAIELDERSRTLARGHISATELVRIATENGYRAVGQTPSEKDWVLLDPEDPALFGVEESYLDDAVIFAGSPRAVRETWVNECMLVEDGVHKNYTEIANFARPVFQALAR
jgi:formiminoglutamate deiminase